ncbi:MAG: hypothetical protein JRE43_02800, partial [Deltaproteobacteria bacterium]|nr:hypothetical protein [Deltaproteobacteria bacterium]
MTFSLVEAKQNIRKFHASHCRCQMIRFGVTKSAISTRIGRIRSAPEYRRGCVLQVGSTRWWASGSIALLLAGCVTTPIRHDYELAPGQAFSQNRSRALLIPINETEEVPAGLEVGEDNVFEQLKSYLESKGLSIETTNSWDYRSAANNAAESVHNEMLSAESSSISGEIEYSSIVPRLLANL